MKNALALALACVSLAASAARRISVEEYRDKMKAGWLGQMIGVEWGLPTEFRWQGSPIPDDKVPAWRPEMVNGAYGNDDLFVEMTFLSTLERHGLAATARQAGIDYANSRYGLCAANWVGRENLRRGMVPPDCGHPAHNLCADNIDYQIESDYAGLISPGLPNTPIRLANVFGALVNSGDGVHAGQFMGGMYAEAFFTKDVDALLDAGLACIPPDSQYAGMVRDVRKWHAENPGDWLATWRKIEARYIDDPAYHRGKIDQPGSDVKPNGAFVVAGLLYGKGDLAATMRYAMRGGWDSDCNPSSAGGVLACALGTRALEQAMRFALDPSRKFAYTDYTFQHLLAVCERLARENVASSGGRIVRDTDGREFFEIPRQTPRPDRYRPNWNPAPPTGARYSDEEMKQIVEKPFPGIGGTVRQQKKAPPVPLGDGSFLIRGHKEEVGMNLITTTNAPIDLDLEERPIRIENLTNTVIHLAWGKYHTRRSGTVFAFSNCSNVVLRTGSIFFHAPAEVPPALYTMENCAAIRACELSVQTVK